MLQRLRHYTPRTTWGRIAILIVLVLGLLLFLYSPLTPIFIISVWLAYTYLGRKFSSTYINSKILLFVVTFFTHTAVYGLLVIIFSAISDLSLQAVLFVQLLIFALLLAYETIRNPIKTLPKRVMITSADIVAIIVSVVAFLLLAVVPLVNLSVQKQHSSVLTLITGNVDYGTHLAIYNDYLGFGKVRIWNTSPTARSTGGGFYPSSWHAANAAITSVVAPSVKPGALSTAAFGFLNVFWISVLVFFSSRLAFTLYDSMNGGKRKNFATYLIFISLPLVVFYFFDIHLMRFGFFSFTPQLIAVLLLVYSLHQLLHEGIGKKSILALAVLYCSITLAAWILLLPVAAAAVIIALVVTFKRKGQTLTDMYADLLANWPIYLIAAASAFTQIWLIETVKSSSTVGLSHGLLMDGGAPIYNTWMYALLFAGIIGAILYAKDKVKDMRNSYEPTLIALAATVIFACFIFGFQTYHTSTTHYYYYKTLMLIPAILSPLGIAMLGIMVTRLKDTTLAILVAIVIPVTLVQLVPNDMGMAAFIRGSRTVSANVDNDVWIEMHNNTYPNKIVTIYFVNSGSNETSTIATLLVQANRPHNQCFTTLNSDITFMPLDSALKMLTTESLPSSCSGYNVTFKVDESYAPIVNKIEGRKYNIEFIHG